MKSEEKRERNETIKKRKEKNKQGSNSKIIKLAELKFDKNGLIPAIVQDKKTKDVLMIAYMSKQSLEISIKEKRTCFYSRSRKILWRKGETSGNIQKIKEIRYDCDKDALLLLVEQTRVACHTGEWSCFYRKIL